MADDLDLDKLAITGAVKATVATNPFDRLSLDRLALTAALRTADPLNPFDRLLLDRLGLTAAVRGPAIGIAQGSGAAQATAGSEVVLAIRPSADDAVGGWKNESNGSVLYSSISKPIDDDATYVRAAQGIANDTARVKLDLPAYELGDEVYVSYRIGKYPPLATQALDITVRLLQGTTQVTAWTHADVSGTPASFTRTLGSSEIAGITNFSNLFLEFVSNPY